HVDGEREAGPASFDRLDAMPCGVGHSTGALAPLEIRRRIPRGDLPDPFGKLRLFQAEATAYGDLPRGQRLNGVDGLDATRPRLDVAHDLPDSLLTCLDLDRLFEPHASVPQTDAQAYVTQRALALVSSLGSMATRLTARREASRPGLSGGVEPDRRGRPSPGSSRRPWCRIPGGRRQPGSTEGALGSSERPDPVWLTRSDQACSLANRPSSNAARRRPKSRRAMSQKPPAMISVTMIRPSQAATTQAKIFGRNQTPLPAAISTTPTMPITTPTLTISVMNAGRNSVQSVIRFRNLSKPKRIGATVKPRWRIW